jgi:hypothetical protein
MNEVRTQLHSMISIGLAAELILNKLRVIAQLEPTEKHHEERERDARSTAADEESETCDKGEIRRRSAVKGV